MTQIEKTAKMRKFKFYCLQAPCKVGDIHGGTRSKT